MVNSEMKVGSTVLIWFVCLAVLCAAYAVVGCANLERDVNQQPDASVPTDGRDVSYPDATYTPDASVQPDACVPECSCDNDCDSGETCRAGKCYDRCYCDAQCHNNESCHYGICK